jgi:hypothetical protein
VIIGAILEAPMIFMALWITLWLSAFFPRWNPFEAVYNRFSSRFRLFTAPPPRRFAQWLAGSMALAIALLLRAGYRRAAIAIESSLLAAVAAILFRGFCFGSWMFHRLTGSRFLKAPKPPA